MLWRILLLSLFATGTWATVAWATTGQSLTYPNATRDTVVADFHGVKVPDPYRWMEDIDAPATRTWVQAEDKLSRNYLNALPQRDAIAQRLRQIWNYERWSAPIHHGSHWFYTHNDGLQNQSVIYVTTDPATPGHVLLDPNALSKDGTVALRETAVSDDGRLFAYALSDAGSDWQTWHVRDVATGKDLPDALKWSKAGGGSWRKDDTGFYYTRYSAPSSGEALKAANQYEKLYFHRLGTPQSSDVLVYTRRDNPDWFVGGQVTDDGRYLVITANFGDQVQNTLLVQHIAERSRGSGLAGDGPVIAIIPKPTSIYTFIGNVGTMFYLLTDDEAPRNRIIAIDLAHPERAKWRTVVPESK